MADLRVVALIPAKPGSEETVRSVLTKLAAATRDHEGCVSYDLFESAGAPGTFVFIETWASQEALDAHMQTQDIADAMTAAADHLGGSIDIHPLAPVS